MSNNSDFFGSVFDDPNEDPLLGGEESAGEGPPEQPDSEKQPSWMFEGDEHSNGQASSSNGYSNGRTSSSNTGRRDACRKEIVVDQRRAEADGIDALNRAVGEGWRLVRLSLDRPDGEQAASRTAAHRFVAILEQEEPRSLFDFGCSS